MNLLVEGARCWVDQRNVRQRFVLEKVVELTLGLRKFIGVVVKGGAEARWNHPDRDGIAQHALLSIFVRDDLLAFLSGLKLREEGRKVVVFDLSSGNCVLEQLLRLSLVHDFSLS